MFDVFRENAADFFPVNKQVVGPFGLGMNPARVKEIVDSNRCSHGEGGNGGQWGVGGVVDRKTEVSVGGAIQGRSKRPVPLV